MPRFNCESPQTGGSWEGQAQGRFSFSKAACKMQSLKPVGGRLVLLNFLITFSAGASFPFDAVLVSLAVVQGEYLISYGELKGFFCFFFFFFWLLVTPAPHNEHPCPYRVRSTMSGVRQWVSVCLAVQTNWLTQPQPSFWSNFPCCSSCCFQPFGVLPPILSFWNAGHILNVFISLLSLGKHNSKWHRLFNVIYKIIKSTAIWEERKENFDFLRTPGK